MSRTATGTRMEISFNSYGKKADRTMRKGPESLSRFLQRCFEELTQYFRHEWSNWYRLQGEVETDWLSESSMFGFLKEQAS